MSDVNKYRFDTTEFEALFRNTYPALVRYAVRFSGDTQEAKDIVQDAFIAFWQNRDTIDIHTGLRPYLYQAVRNRALNHRRDRKKMESLDEDTLASQADKETAVQYSKSMFSDASDTRSTSSSLFQNDVAASEEKIKMIRLWIRELPDRQREAFELSRFDGLSHEEIALVMDVSKKTVNNHLVAALKSIKKKHHDHFNKQ